MSEIIITMTITELRPDNREFRQNSCVLVPVHADGLLVQVGISIPFEPAYIQNYIDIATAQMDSNAKAPNPILTSLGLRWILNKSGEHFQPENVTPDDFKQKSPDDWSDTSELPKEKIDWSDNAEPSPQAKEIEEIWDGNNDGDPDEKWNDKEESWE